jgi:uncharacterized protein YwqG
LKWLSKLMFWKKKSGHKLPKFHDEETLEKALQEFGISADASRKLAHLGRFSLHLEPTKKGRANSGVFSKVGGSPALPNGVEWPFRPSWPQLANKARNNDQAEYYQSPQPYNFIAQISFEEMLATSAKGLSFPTQGALYLFYDDLAHCWGFDPKHALGFKVIYVPSVENVEIAQKPEFHEDVPSYGEVVLEPKLQFEYCPPEGLHFEDLAMSASDKDAYIQFVELIEGQPELDWRYASNHKVLGWSNNVQAPMEEQCALVTSGIYCGGPEGYNSPEAQKIMSEPNEWVQLLEIGTDDEAGMMWGDMGTLFLWIKQSDLEYRSFENTWLILQCS